MVKKNYDAIDLTKFIASIFVLGIHASLFEDILPVLNTFIFEGFARLAVPFFFISSAFFFFKKEVDFDNTKRYCKRLLVLYLAWFIVSFPKTIFDRIICSEYSLIKASILFLRSFFVTSTFSGSWFIVSCVFCALLFYYLEKLQDKTRIVLTIVLSAVIYLWCVMTSAYGDFFFGTNPKAYEIYKLIFANPYCSFIVGVPYFALARHFAKTDTSLYQLKLKINALFSIFFIALFLAEVYFVNKFELKASTDCFLSLVPCAYFIFSFVLGFDIHIANAKRLRVASTIVFFSQFLLLFFCEFAEWLLKITIISPFKFLFALVMSLMLTELILLLQDKKGFTWLRYFY